MSEHVYDDGFPACAAERVWVDSGDGTCTAHPPHWIKNPQGPWSHEELSVFADIAERARRGEKKAQKKAFRMVAEAMRAGVVSPPHVAEYVMLALLHCGRGEAPMRQAFAPLGRQSPERTRARKRFEDSVLFHWCEHAIKRMGLSTSRDGDPGPAFEHVARAYGLSAATVRDRYYRFKRQAEAQSKD
ncbi:MAG: hypothetical protein JXM75_10935 [Chromatiaceae bacterium]|nr:hypothetical protein [Chromatiaceae bacterium]